MRFFVLCVSDHIGVAPHIVAEAVRDGGTYDRSTSLASALAGDRALILTRDELMVEATGRAALEAWDDRDDAEYAHESEAILADDELPPVRRLRLVPNSR